MSNKYFVINGTAATKEEAILLCAKTLQEEGIVDTQFGPKCVEREKEFPTGLPTELPTAIPHVKDDNITENAICFLRLDTPVTFHRMDDDEETVETDMIFNLAIKDPNEHLEVLQNMMDFLSDTEVLENCKNLPGGEAAAYLENRLG